MAYSRQAKMRQARKRARDSEPALFFSSSVCLCLPRPLKRHRQRAGEGAGRQAALPFPPSFFSIFLLLPRHASVSEGGRKEV